MLKAWSITTTVRNPERIRDFLIALKPLVGKEWNNYNQENYQKILIKNRLYGYGNQQFYNGLQHKIVDLINDVDSKIDDETVENILEAKNYTDFAMRGRQSINPLTKFGFAHIDRGILKITDLGHKLIASEKDPGEVFLKSFIKWQIPNPANDDFSDDGNYEVVPFVATLKLISEVNKIEVKRGNKPVGLSKREFSLFVPSLVKHSVIKNQANKIIEFRDMQKGKTSEERKEIRDKYRQVFAANFLENTAQVRIDKFLANLNDYGDNTIRYFRLTKFIRIRGNGYYVDLEPNRHTEIESLLDGEFFKPKIFPDREAYLDYMSDDNQPRLPWQSREKLLEIIINIDDEIIKLQKKLGLVVSSSQDFRPMSENELISNIDSLRIKRQLLEEKYNHVKAQPTEAISKYIEQLTNIYNCDNRALMLEYLSTMGLHALNDAKEIKPNYPVGDDNEPTSTAPGGMADIECHYISFNMICEVTMLNGRGQWFNEGQPVMRHLRAFENNHDNSYCLFIAPTIHADSAETFWVANNHGYKGNKQKIVPVTIKQFVKVLKTLKLVRESNKIFTHDSLEKLLKNIVMSSETINNSDDWVENVESIVDAWSTSLVGIPPRE